MFIGDINVIHVTYHDTKEKIYQCLVHKKMQACIISQDERKFATPKYGLLNKQYKTSPKQNFAKAQASIRLTLSIAANECKVFCPI